MSKWIANKSLIDESINFTKRTDGGMWEARYVRRTEEKASIYLSSQDGCNQSCRMCHLTATGQTSSNNATIDDYVEQFSVAISHLTRKNWPKHFNINLMARGEPLLNSNLIDNYKGFYSSLKHRLELEAQNRGVSYSSFRVNISTIMPNSLQASDFNQLCESVRATDTQFYYSVYSNNEDFRKRWLPHAMPIDRAMSAFWYNLEHKNRGRELVVHWPFIAGQNDDQYWVTYLCNQLKSYGVYLRVNIVRFNSPDDKKHQETNEYDIQNLFRIICKLLPNNENHKIIDRVGLDVAASCGTFLE